MSINVSFAKYDKDGRPMKEFAPQRKKTRTEKQNGGIAISENPQKGGGIIKM